MTGQILIQLTGLLILAGLAIGVWQLWRELRRHRIWDRQRFAQQYLSTFVTGEFPLLREKIEKIQECQIWNSQDSYALKCEAFSQDRLDTIEPLLKKILNIFEGMCINIEYQILEEEICYNYLGWLLVAYYRWSNAYINGLRQRSGDPLIYINLERYAKRWDTRINKESLS